MIGFVRGKLVAKQPPDLVIDVGGVGYELQAPMSTFYSLPPVGETVSLVTHHLVREDAQLLFGFASEEERGLFRSLLKVSGIGARIGLTILSGITAAGFRDCVENKDVATLVKLPGIGRKTAERLLVEMADRLPAATSPSTPGTGGHAESEAFGALLALGYKPVEVTRLLKGLNTESQSTEDIIREALRQLNSQTARASA